MPRLDLVRECRTSHIGETEIMTVGCRLRVVEAHAVERDHHREVDERLVTAAVAQPEPLAHGPVVQRAPGIRRRGLEGETATAHREQHDDRDPHPHRRRITRIRRRDHTRSSLP
jgi:hypothetical protein